MVIFMFCQFSLEKSISFFMNYSPFVIFWYLHSSYHTMFIHVRLGSSFMSRKQLSVCLSLTKRFEYHFPEDNELDKRHHTLHIFTNLFIEFTISDFSFFFILIQSVCCRFWSKTICISSMNTFNNALMCKIDYALLAWTRSLTIQNVYISGLILVENCAIRWTLLSVWS